MKFSPLVFGLLPLLIAFPALGVEAAWKCNYQFGLDSSADRRKIGTVVVAIDLDAKTAAIDFGKGWFKKMTLTVDGMGVKETSPPASGPDLGWFYFDTANRSGGIAGDPGDHEFFDACVPTTIDEKLSETDQKSESSDNGTSVAESSSAAKIPLPKSQESPASQSDSVTSKTPPIQQTETPATAPPRNERGTTIDPDKKKAVSSRPDVDIAPQPPKDVAAISIAPPSDSPTEPPKADESAPASVVSEPTKESEETPSSPMQAKDPAAEKPAVEQDAVCKEALEATIGDAKVSFPNASADIAATSEAALEKIAVVAKNCTSVGIEIDGHTDSFGNAIENKELSQHRAQAVVDFLIKEGVNPTILKSIGYGQERPIASNATSEGRQLNRRVEFHVSGIELQSGAVSESIIAKTKAVETNGGLNLERHRADRIQLVKPTRQGRVTLRHSARSLHISGQRIRPGGDATFRQSLRPRFRARYRAQLRQPFGRHASQIAGHPRRRGGHG
jgi:outer membrane protein OmpA-like peptidoglycan-associated protein